jgi:hypothetical protein
MKVLNRVAVGLVGLAISSATLAEGYSDQVRRKLRESKDAIELNIRSIGKDDAYKTSYSITRGVINDFDCSDDRRYLLGLFSSRAWNNDLIARFIKSNDVLEVFAAAYLALDKSNIAAEIDAAKDINKKQKFLLDRYQIISGLLSAKIDEIKKSGDVNCKGETIIEGILKQYFFLISSEVGANFRSSDICRKNKKLISMHRSILQEKHADNRSYFYFWEDEWREANFSCGIH